jgi:hypothetical protein
MGAQYVETEPGPVRSEGDHIVLTVTPQQARDVAAAIAAGSAGSEVWLTDLAHALETEATERLGAVPPVSRGSFLRGRWAGGKDAAEGDGPESYDVSRAIIEHVARARARYAVEQAGADEAAEGEVHADAPAVSVADMTEKAQHAARTLAEARTAQLAARRAVQSAAVLQLRVDAAAARLSQAGSPDATVATAEEAALAAAAVARAVATAAAQAAATASAAADAFQREVGVATDAPAAGTGQANPASAGITVDGSNAAAAQELADPAAESAVSPRSIPVS